MRFLPIALIAAAFIIYGCISVSQPQECAALPADKQPGCVYYSAVMQQNPYACYAISDLKDRETCLKDAIDTSALKTLQRQPRNSQQKVPTGALPQPGVQPVPEGNAANGTQEAPAPPENATNLSS